MKLMIDNDKQSYDFISHIEDSELEKKFEFKLYNE